jgi:large subunit ribosomal protein L10
MSKPIKKLITDSYAKRFGEMDGAIVMSIRGVNSKTNTKLRARLKAKNIRVTVVRNSLARVAFKGTKLEQLTEILDGPCALIYGAESVVHVAREVVALTKEMEAEPLEFKGALMEGNIFTAKQIVELSKYPTRTEAISQLAGLLLGPGRTLAGQILGPGRTLGGIAKAIEAKAPKEAEAPAAPATPAA